jgi:hypothetical protein
MNREHATRSTYQEGFVALISVLALSAVAVTIGAGLVIRAVGQGNMSVTDDAGIRAEMAAQACAEQALMNLKNSTNYSGNETLTLSNGDTCRIRAVGGTGNTNRTVQTTSTVMTATRKIQVNVASINPTMSISSWQDVVDF